MWVVLWMFCGGNRTWTGLTWQENIVWTTFQSIIVNNYGFVITCVLNLVGHFGKYEKNLIEFLPELKKSFLDFLLPTEWLNSQTISPTAKGLPCPL